MPNFIGQSCTLCHNTIADGEDIVVCPECGSPYHRECYAKEGRCINTALHESGQSWTPEPVKPIYGDNTESASIVPCKNCGTDNNSQDAFCKNCGAPINMEKAAGVIYQRIKQDDAEAGGATFTGAFSPYTNFAQFKPDSDLDGIKVSEYNSYIGPKWMYFLPKFMRFSKVKTKTSFNFGAFFFPHLYFFYRKMIPIGIVMLALMTVLSLPSTLELLVEREYLPKLVFMNSEWFAGLSKIFSFISFIVEAAAGFFANWLYYKKAKSDIERIKSTTDDDGQLKMSIAYAGGTSWAYVLTAAIATSVISMLFIFLIYRFMGA